MSIRSSSSSKSVGKMSDFDSSEFSSSSISSEVEFISSVSDCSQVASSLPSRKSQGSIHSDTRDVRNVLKKRYSKIALGVQGVREGDFRKQISMKKRRR